MILHIFCMGVNIGCCPWLKSFSMISAAISLSLLMRFHPFVHGIWFYSCDFILFLLGLQLHLFGDIINGQSLFAVWCIRIEPRYSLIIRAFELRLFDYLSIMLVLHLTELVVLCRSWSGHVWSKNSDIFNATGILSMTGGLSSMIEQFLTLHRMVRINTWLHRH